MKIFIEKSIIEIQEMIREKKISVKDLMDECILNSRKYEKYKFWNSFNEGLLIERYNELEGPDEVLQEPTPLLRETPVNPTYPYNKGKDSIYGIPFGVKDVFNTIDYTTEMGSVIWKGFNAGNDARVVSNLIYHRGIMAGKTVTAEFAVHSLNETLNPYDIKRTPGTSSSGSAVATALGVVPFALATQTAGSIIRPASFCGVFGCKPSFGTIPRTGVLKTTDSLDSVGFITTNIYNLRTIFDILSVKGLDYPYQYSAFSDKKRQACGERKWKIAFVKTYVWDEAEDYVKNEICKLIDRISRDEEVELVEKDINNIIDGAHEVHEIIYNKSLSYYFANEHNDRERVSAVMTEMLDRGDSVSSKRYLEALTVQDEMCKKMDDFMLDYDAVLSMSTASVAPFRHEIEKKDPSLIWTLLHLCSVTIPAFNEKNLPFGIQVSGRRYNDYLLFDFVEFLAKKGYVPYHSKVVL